MTVSFLPLSQIGQQLPYIFLIANEIVVDDEDCSTPSKISQRIKFSEHLLIALGARHTSVDFDDVAELAREGTTARVLNRHGAVPLQIREMKIGSRSQ